MYVRIKCNAADLRLHPTTHTQGHILISYRNHNGMYVCGTFHAHELKY